MNKQPWDISLDTCGEKRLAALMRALILTKSIITETFQIRESENLDPHWSIFFRVQVPIDAENKFEEISKCKLAKLPRIQVGMDTSPGFPYKGSFAKNPRFPY